MISGENTHEKRAICSTMMREKEKNVVWWLISCCRLHLDVSSFLVFFLKSWYLWGLHFFYLQDSMVICRLRKNSEFRLNDSSNRASLSQKPLSTTPNSDCAVSEAGTDQVDKAVECCSKKCSSSYDSYSIEQIDSGSESNQKVTSEVTQPECSGQQKVGFFIFLFYVPSYCFLFLFLDFLSETLYDYKYHS